MRGHLIGAVAAALLLVPGAALAQDADDPCYVDPTSPECVEVGGVVDEVDGEVDADDGEEVVVEVRGETLTAGDTTGDALATTGLEVGTALAIVAALLAAGALLLVSFRRRRSS